MGGKNTGQEEKAKNTGFENNRKKDNTDQCTLH